MINNIKVKNFKGFSDFEIKDFKQINIITGQNNSGKSSLLEAIGLLYNPVCANSINRFYGYTKDSFASFFHNLNTESAIEISTSNENLTLKVLFEEEVSKEEQIFINNGKPENITTKQENLHLFYNSDTNKTDLFLDTFMYGSKYQNLYISDTKLNSLNNIYYFDCIKHFDEMQTNKEEYSIIKVLRETIAPELENITLSRNDSLKVDLGYDKMLSFGALGDGIKKLFMILIALYSTRNGILLIDEIETGFHYSVLNSVWETLIKASKEFNVQVFISTHSKECIESYMYVFEKLKLKDDFDSYYRLERDKNDVKYIKYSSGELKAAIENNLEMR